MEATPSGVEGRVGPYELLLPIGSGGMATVYLARHLGLERDRHFFALKLTHPHVRAEQQHRTRQIVDEARIAARIRHPNVTTVIDVDDDPCGVFLVMEYVEGDSLAGLMRVAAQQNERIPLAVGLAVVCDALEGLNAAHDLTTDDGELVGLVHRDFTPHNIIVGLDGISRLTDFGIAKLKDGAAATESGVVKGKFGYLAPEQLRGRELDRRTDVWAAGVILWELCTGERLYADVDQAASMLRLVTEKPRRVRSVVPDLPEALDAAVAGALELDPARRWKTAHELAEQLRAAFDVADRQAVAGFVKKIAGPRLAERTLAVEKVCSERAAKNTGIVARSRRIHPRALGIIAGAAATVVLLSALALTARSGARASKPAPATAASSGEVRAEEPAVSPAATSTSTTASPAPTSASLPSVSPSASSTTTIATAAAARPRATKAPARPAKAGKNGGAPSLLDNPYRE